MARDRRKQNIARLFRNLRIIETRFSRALRRLRRNIAKDAASHRDLTSIKIVIQFRQHEITALNKAWFKRIMDLFARERIDYLQERIGQAKKADAYNTYQNNVNRWIDQRAGNLSKRVVGNMVNTARDVLTDSVDEGWGTDKTSRELERQLGGSTLNNDSFARTEMHTAANVGSDAAARSTGLDMVKEWAATDDTRTRETHQNADGQRVEMDERFAVGDAMLAYPGDPSGPANEVINCRCVTLYHPRINGVVYD
jgi:uncharacterized protein with gpF-like domain